ncbi:uncharacterized protein LOC126322569 [Schistocerca gregaria]|uniref:uncharacterized protein LOC126322569 n=1 Tax=Schistocerca gregaria TaxID=7010 RepID=UPI00211E7542|nr:uncharacterized protein LOC126322569 [Schistocerca gregaria]
MSFGQVVLGPPGSGKTTYCHGMKQFLTALGRKVAIINLDPANDTVPYEPNVDISSLITLEDAMSEFGLGPNGGLMYCMEYLEKNVDWLQSELEKIQDQYLLFDFPGQVELFTHHESTKKIIGFLLKKGGNRLACLHLVDSYYCSSPFIYLSAILLSLSTMLHLELPHINVFSKIDMIEKFKRLDFSLEFYADVVDMSHLANILEYAEPSPSRFKKMTQALCEIIEDFSLVSFTTLNIQDKKSMAELVKLVDKTNGYIYACSSPQTMLENITSADVDFEYNRIAAIQEKYMDNEEEEEDE